MSKNIQINLTNIIKQDDNSETFHFDEFGTLTTIRDHSYIRFTETAPVTTPVTVKINPDQTIAITRNGQSKLQLVLDLNNSNTIHYQTPIGMIMMIVKTTKLSIDLTKGAIFAEYQLWQTDQIVGQYTFDLHFK